MKVLFSDRVPRQQGRPAKTARTARTVKTANSAKTANKARAVRTARTAPRDRPVRPERPVRPDRTARTARPERPERPEPVERPEPAARPVKTARTVRTELQDKVVFRAFLEFPASDAECVVINERPNIVSFCFISYLSFSLLYSNAPSPSPKIFTYPYGRQWRPMNKSIKWGEKNDANDSLCFRLCSDANRVRNSNLIDRFPKPKVAPSPSFDVEAAYCQFDERTHLIILRGG